MAAEMVGKNQFIIWSQEAKQINNAYAKVAQQMKIKKALFNPKRWAQRAQAVS